MRRVTGGHRCVAQDCYYEDAGAYTGRVSTGMLKSVGCDYVVAGCTPRLPLLAAPPAPAHSAPRAPGQAL